jgi:hypothetical protein
VKRTTKFSCVVSPGCTYFGQELFAFRFSNIEIATAARVARVVGSIKERSSVTLCSAKNRANDDDSDEREEKQQKQKICHPTVSIDVFHSIVDFTCTTFLTHISLYY